MVQSVQNRICEGVSSTVRVGTQHFSPIIRHMCRRSHVRAASPPGGSTQACPPPATVRYGTERKKNPQIQKSVVLAEAALSKEVAGRLDRLNRLLKIVSGPLRLSCFRYGSPGSLFAGVMGALFRTQIPPSSFSTSNRADHLTASLYLAHNTKKCEPPGAE